MSDGRKLIVLSCLVIGTVAVRRYAKKRAALPRPTPGRIDRGGPRADRL